VEQVCHALLPIHAARRLIIFKPRLTFLPHPQRLMVSSPSPLHELIVTHLLEELTCTVRTISLPQSLRCRSSANQTFSKESIEGIPDLTVDMWSSHNTESRRVVVGECAFTQSDEDVTEKLRAYVLNAPDILVVCKILIKQGDRYCSPGRKPSVANGLRSSHLLTRAEFSSAIEGDFAQMVVDGHTWLSISSVEIHVWVRQPGDSDINLDCLPGDGYTVGVCRLISYVYVYHTDSH